MIRTDNSISRTWFSRNLCHRPGMVHSGHCLIRLVVVHHYLILLHCNKEQVQAELK